MPDEPRILLFCVYHRFISLVTSYFLTLGYISPSLLVLCPRAVPSFTIPSSSLLISRSPAHLTHRDFLCSSLHLQYIPDHVLMRMITFNHIKIRTSLNDCVCNGADT